MKTWHLFLPFALMVIFAGYIGFRLGQASPPSETDVIARWADEYVDWAGPAAHPSDCAARPGRGDVWIVITCVPTTPALQSITYHVSHDGDLTTPDDSSTGPEA